MGKKQTQTPGIADDWDDPDGEIDESEMTADASCERLS